MSWTRNLDPDLVERIQVLLSWTSWAGYPLRVSSAYRSREKQQALYDAWKSGRSQLPAAPPGSSAHERGLAVDLVWVRGGLQEPVEGAWETLGGVAEEYLGLRWGGRFRTPDRVHFELRRLGGGS